MPSNLVEVETFTTPIPVPIDGEAGTVASVNVAFQALANRTALLKGGYKVVNLGVTSLTDTSDAHTTHQTITGSTNYTTFTAISRGLSGLKVGDIVLVAVSVQAQWTIAAGSGSGGHIRLSVEKPSAGTDIIENAKMSLTNSDAAIGRGRIIVGSYTCTEDGGHTFKIQGRVLNAAESLVHFGSASYIALAMRAT